MRKSSKNSGFAIGMILAAILLMAAITTFIAVTNRGSNDITEERLQLEMTAMRNFASNAVKAALRIADSCPRIESEYKSCIAKIQTSLRMSTPCENSNDDEKKRFCVYHDLYGGLKRSTIDRAVLSNANARWDIAFNVSQPSSSETIDMVLFLDGLTERACITLEKIILQRANPVLANANSLASATKILPYARMEGCFKRGNIAWNDEIIDRPRFAYPITLAKMGGKEMGDKNMVPFEAEGYQYYLVVPRVR